MIYCIIGFVHICILHIVLLGIVVLCSKLSYHALFTSFFSFSMKERRVPGYDERAREVEHSSCSPIHVVLNILGSLVQPYSRSIV